MLRVSTSESMIPRPCFQILQSSLIYCSTASVLSAILPPSTTRQQALFWRRYYCSYLFIPPVFHYLFAELVHLLGVLGTQETSCFVVAGLHERDIFDLFLPEIDKPWVIHLRENLLLFYKPLLLEAQHCLQEKEGEVDIKLFSGAVAGEER